MPNTIRHKRGTTVPTAGVLQTGEIAINTTNGFAYTKTDGGSVVQIGSTTDLSLYAPLASPALTGVPTAPTATTGTATTQIATTGFVQTAISGMSVTAAQTTIAEVRNQTGATLTKGTVIYLSGASGNKPLALKAQANTEATSAFTFGIVQNDISNNANGYVVTEGALSNVATNTYTDGTLLYLSPTVAGGFTATKPSSPNHIVFIGIVTYAHATQGIIQVSLQNGYQLDELHDVDAILPSNDKEILAYTLSDQTWRNRTASYLGLAELSGANFSGQVNIGGSSALQISPSGYIVSGDAGSASDWRSYFSKDAVYTVNGTQSRGGVYRTGTVAAGASVPASLANSTSIWLGDTNTGLSTVQTLIGNGKFYSNTANAGWVEPYLSFASLSNYAVLNSTQTFAQPQVISSPSGATLPALRITNEASATTAHSLVVGDATNPDTTSFVINNAGNVGIGVDPATWTTTKKLEVVGDVSITGTTSVTGKSAVTWSGSGTAFQVTNTGTGHSLLVEDSASPDATGFIINADGNIGVGVNQSSFIATAKFAIFNSSSLPSAIISQSGTGSALQITNTGTGNTLVVEDETSPDTSALIVNASGNVGIGVPTGWTPIAKFDVYNSSATPTVSIDAGGSGTALIVTNRGTGNSLVVEDVASPDSDAFVINASGSVGIGVATSWTPQEKLDVNGYISCTTAPLAPWVSSSRVATTGYVRSAVIPEVIDGATYDPSSSITKWNSLVRIDDTATFSLQLPLEGVGTELPIGTQIVFLQANVGRIDFSPTNGNVVMSAGGRYLTKEQYSVATAIKTGVDEWLIAGDLVVS